MPSLLSYHSLLTSLADSHGGALVNIIHGYTENGDPFVRKFTDQLLEDVWTSTTPENERHLTRLL